MVYQVKRIPGDGTLAEAFEVRREVFIDEQDVDEEIEMDGNDEDAIHFVVTVTTTETPVGTARLRIPEPGLAKPERVAVREEYRGEDIGRKLMDLVESEAKRQGCELARLHAQTHVVPFYEKIGYEITSEEFEEAGIPHVEMEKDL